jgi:hypothetical protein
MNASRNRRLALALSARSSGTLNAQMKSAQLALDDFNSAMKLAPDDAGIRFKRVGFTDRFEADYARAIELDPSLKR